MSDYVCRYCRSDRHVDSVPLLHTCHWRDSEQTNEFLANWLSHVVEQDVISAHAQQCYTEHHACTVYIINALYICTWTQLWPLSASSQLCLHDTVGVATWWIIQNGCSRGRAKRAPLLVLIMISMIRSHNSWCHRNVFFFRNSSLDSLVLPKKSQSTWSQPLTFRKWLLSDLMSRSTMHFWTVRTSY